MYMPLYCILCKTSRFPNGFFSSLISDNVLLIEIAYIHTWCCCAIVKQLSVKSVRGLDDSKLTSNVMCFLYHDKARPLPTVIIPANTRHWPNVGLMLGQRRRRWPDIGPTLCRCFVFSGKGVPFLRMYIIMNILKRIKEMEIRKMLL